MKIKEFRNPWYNKQSKNKEIYKTNSDTLISEYRGYYILTRVNTWVDVVEWSSDEYVCVTQVGSVRYAKKFIDGLMK